MARLQSCIHFSVRNRSGNHWQAFTMASVEGRFCWGWSA